MKLDDQVCSLEQAKKLVELGVVMDTTWYWIDNEFLEYKDQIDFEELETDNVEWLPAPNVAELGVLLPEEPLIEDYLCELVVDKYGDDCWDVGYRQIRTDGEYKITYCLIDEGWETEAQARADALIWLIENDYVKVEDLKL